ncbi:MAG TPA: MFS transporter [Solirubrobacterales bacterium]|nr:MFS transporter [Solirubrobacterales bacterium]
MSSARAAAGAPTAVVAMLVFGVAVTAFARVPLLPDIGEDLTLTAGEVGLLTAAFGVGRLATDLPAGRLADVVGPTVAMTGSGILLALACGLLAVSGSFAEALAASALIGVASAITNTTGMYAFATAGGAERRGASMALYVTALMSGQMIGPALGGAIGTLTGWRPAIALAGTIGIAVATVAFVVSRRLPDRRAAGREAQEAGVAPSALPPRRELVALGLAPFATFFGMAGLTQTLIPLVGANELDYSASVIGIAIAVGAAVRFASAWAAGIASDRLSRKVVLVPNLAVMALGAAALAISTSVVAWGLAIALIALGSSGISVAAAAVADRVPAATLGRELGRFRLVGDLGLLVGPAVLGFVYGASGPRAASAVAAGVFAAATVASAVWVGEDPRPHAPDTGELVLE